MLYSTHTSVVKKKMHDSTNIFPASCFFKLLYITRPLRPGFKLAMP